jgi:hypothetical protein
MSAWVRGDECSPATIAEIKGAFGYRWTFENERRVSWWAPFVAQGTAPTMALVSDAEWLAEHAFRVRADGHLDARYGYSEPASIVGVS